ncbi:MAG: hypothetical protein K5918_08900 [Bacteroidales bacterium]|nr:hypothetical protein [Bacteroidales bacterium]
MKKGLLFSAVALLMMSLSSCDENLLIDAVEEGLLGSAEITITGQNGYYSNDTTIHFASTIADNIDTVIENQAVIGTIDIFANVNLREQALAFPFMGFQITDTTTGTYTLSNVLTADRLRNFKFDSIADIFFNPSGFNVLLIAVSDTAWYISNGGTITITEYPGYGHNMKGTFNNVDAYYFTISDVERLNDNWDDIQANGLVLSDYFEQATINGEFNSRRYAMIHDLINAAYTQRGLWE